jgi:glycosyltransferase involved in cell wall biosynthesis
MKGLFIVFHGFNPYSGISKKINAQREALCQCGLDIDLCFNRIEADGTQNRMVDDNIIHGFGRGIRSKVLKRICYGDMTDYIVKNNIGFLYIRHDFNSNPFLIHWLKQVKKDGVRVVLEIPTYPYDSEFQGAQLSDKLTLATDKIFRRSLVKNIDKVVTFSDATSIFGCQTIRISNGIDFDKIHIKGTVNNITDEVHFLVVANIHIWHGIDRIINGLAQYYSVTRDRIVKLRIVGDGVEQLIEDYRRMIIDASLQDYVVIAGPHSGKDLESDFEWADMGIASLGRHRTNITNIKTLKNREFAARGIPFVYSEQDSDFDDKPYVVRVPPDESPIDVKYLLDRLDAINRNPAEIRSSIEPALSWKNQMSHVLSELNIKEK